MTNCPSLASCPFFNNRMAAMPAMAEMMKKRHCHDNYQSCARWMVSNGRGKEAVPEDLYPNQTDKVAGILAAA